MPKTTAATIGCGFVNQRPVAQSTDLHRETIYTGKGFDACPAGGRTGRLDNGDRADILSGSPSLRQHQVRMRLKEPAGAELDDLPGHFISTIALITVWRS